MTPASVGFQCPDCVAQGRVQQVSAPLVAAAGRPVVTWGIVGLCVVVFAVEWLIGIDAVAGNLGMQPVSIGLYNEWYRLLTSVFLHGSLLHIAFNMYVLVAFGPTLERILGHTRFGVLFIICGLGGSVLSYAVSPVMTLSVGASGAIFGLMGALLVAGRRLRHDVTMVMVLIGINLAIGFVFGSGIDWRAHLGGLATGAAMAAVLVGPGGVRRPVRLEVAGTVLILAVIVAVALVRTVQLHSLVM